MTNATAETSQTETSPEADIINQLAGLTPDSPLAQLRAQRPEVFRHAQGSYLSLLEPEDLAGVSRYEREATALRVAVFTASTALADWHRGRLRELGASDAEIAAVEQFPNGGELSPRLTAILTHSDRVSREPLNSSREHIQALRDAGLSARDIVTIAQLISFLSFQVRTLVGLRILGAA